jgi:alkanesulfonate monooxygenase SsuD/methylene tetrahydromethanopterin reductase-like flavin-dependent oxidoreductase (luciferase family)
MLAAMRFGLALPQYGFSLPTGRIGYDDTVGWARRAEDLGFDSVWLSDHFFYSFARYGADPAPIDALEPLSALAAIATGTARVRLGVLVLAAGFRPPELVAKAAATIDRLSGGRLELGLGAGWLEEEFVAFDYRFGSVGERFEVLERTLHGLTRSLADPGSPGPSPVQDPLPIWVGGKGGPRLLRLAARYAAGWNVVWRTSPEEHALRVADVAAACGREGRDPATFRRTVGLYGTVGLTEGDARRDLGDVAGGHAQRVAGAGGRTGASLRGARRRGADPLSVDASVRRDRAGDRGRVRRARDAGVPVSSAREAVLAVLGDAGEPIHWTVIQDRALRAGYLDPFVEPDVRGAVLRALRALVAEGLVVRTETGVYALA